MEQIENDQSEPGARSGTPAQEVGELAGVVTLAGGQAGQPHKAGSYRDVHAGQGGALRKWVQGPCVPTSAQRQVPLGYRSDCQGCSRFRTADPFSTRTENLLPELRSLQLTMSEGAGILQISAEDGKADGEHPTGIEMQFSGGRCRCSL